MMRHSRDGRTAPSAEASGTSASSDVFLQLTGARFASDSGKKTSAEPRTVVDRRKPARLKVPSDLTTEQAKHMLASLRPADRRALVKTANAMVRTIAGLGTDRLWGLAARDLYIRRREKTHRGGEVIPQTVPLRRLRDDRATIERVAVGAASLRQQLVEGKRR